MQDIRVPPVKMWKPDLLLYNSANEAFDATFPTIVIVKSDGSVSQIPPGSRPISTSDPGPNLFITTVRNLNWKMNYF